MTIDWTKPVRTEEGKISVNIFTIKAKGRFPVIGQIDGDLEIQTWRIDGSPGYETELSLENVPEKRVGYINMYPGSTIYKTRESADSACVNSQCREACIRVEYEEGQFDD